MRTITSLVVIAAIVFSAPLTCAQEVLPRDAEAAALKQMAAGIPLGVRVRVRTIEGQRLTATLMAVDDEGIVLKRRSRVPEPAVAIRFVDLTELRREDKEGFSVAKALGIGLAAGAGAILTLFAIAVTIDD
jgi:hypothetical protein